MNNNFEQTITRFLLHYGKDVLNDYQRCNSLLKDFTKNEYQKETILFMQAKELNDFLPELSERGSCDDRAITGVFGVEGK